MVFVAPHPSSQYSYLIMKAQNRIQKLYYIIKSRFCELFPLHWSEYLNVAKHVLLNSI